MMKKLMGFNTFLAYLEHEKRFSEHTISAYQSDLFQFCTFLDISPDTIDFSIVSAKQIRGWMVSLLSEGRTNKTVNRKLSTLKSLYRFLLREGIVDNNPANKVITPKISKKQPTFINEEKLNFFLETFDFPKDFSGIRDRLIIELFYYTGIRLSELKNLKEIAIDIFAKTIKVFGKRGKERIIPISENLLDLLSQYLNQKKNIANADNRFLFVTEVGEPVYDKLIYRVVTKYLAYVTTAQKKSPHILRHTFATHMLNNGADINIIKEILGHSNLAATQVYTQNSFDKLRSVYKQAHPRAKLKEG